MPDYRLVLECPGQRITGSLPKPGNAKLAAAAQGAASPGATPPPGAVSDGAGAAAKAPLTVPRPAGSVDAGPAAAAVPGGIGGITGSTATPSTGGAAVQPGGAAMPRGGSGGGAGGGTQLPPAPPRELDLQTLVPACHRVDLPGTAHLPRRTIFEQPAAAVLLLARSA